MNDHKLQRTGQTAAIAGEERLTEQLKEQLSPLMYGEPGEFETRRLLGVLGGPSASDLDAARESLAVWERYHLVRSALRPEPMLVSISRDGQTGDTDRLSLSDRINAAVAAEPAHQQPASELPARIGRSGPAGLTWAAGRVAVAATVAFGVFLGMQALVQDGGQSSVGGMTADVTEPVPERQFAVDSDAQQRLNDYIRSVSIPARSEPATAPYNSLLDSSPLLRPVADRELVNFSDEARD